MVKIGYCRGCEHLEEKSNAEFRSYLKYCHHEFNEGKKIQIYHLSKCPKNIQLKEKEEEND